MRTASTDAKGLAAGPVIEPGALAPGGGSATDADIPDKLYFRIGEVSKLADVQQYVLRYWESEFPGLSPKKSGRNHRLYRRKDVELILEIKRLLYDRRFTIEGARKFLDSKVKETPRAKRANTNQQTALFDLGEPREVNQDAIDRMKAELRPTERTWFGGDADACVALRLPNLQDGPRWVLNHGHEAVPHHVERLQQDLAAESRHFGGCIMGVSHGDICAPMGRHAVNLL